MSKRARGFSLLEVVIAMAILAFGLLTLALMQVHALKQGSAGRHTADGGAVGRTYIEQVHRIPWALLTAAVGAGWQNPTWAAAPATVATVVTRPDGGTATEHSYTVQWRVTAIAGTTCLRDVEIRVNWAEQNQPGKQNVLATRRYDWGNPGC
jgi:prepilin-type N-terminal cleavage/methylation domain-containing protein